MKNPKLASRYAHALFDFAKEQDQIEIVNQDLDLVKDVLVNSRDLQVVLNSPVIAPTKKHSIFTAIFQNKIAEISFSFLDVIICKKREPMLTEICSEFTNLYNEYHHKKIATLITAEEMSPELTEKIRQLLVDETHYDIQIETIIQPNLVGGIIIKMGDFYFDASIRSKINKLKAAFAHNEYQVNF